MFRFVFAWQPGDAFDALATDGFIGIETSQATQAAPVIGARQAGNLSTAPETAEYVILGEQATEPLHEVGRRIRSAAETGPNVLLLIENNATSLRTPTQMWTLLEAAHHPKVKLALDVGIARAAGQTPAVLVPTLNLRIGLVRVHGPQDDLIEYARRLAGIGFGGYVVLDPPAGTDRVQLALTLATTFRSVIPVKPVKKAPPPKPTPAAKPSV